MECSALRARGHVAPSTSNLGPTGTTRATLPTAPSCATRGAGSVANLARQCTAEPGCLLASAGSSRFVVEVQLLGDFNVRTGDSLLDTLPPGSQRILAFLALQD